MSKDQPSGEQKGDLLETLRRRFDANEGKNPHSILDYRHQFGNVPGALLYATLFVPEFCLVDDSVILDDGSYDLPIDFLRAKEAWVKDIEELEVSFNWREMPYIFSNTDTTLEECRILANFISKAWEARLGMLFPPREFVVRVLSPDETGGGIGIGFRERRQRSVH